MCRPRARVDACTQQNPPPTRAPPPLVWQEELARRVELRDQLTELDFLEITRPLLSSRGDEIDIQISIFDQARRTPCSCPSSLAVLIRSPS